MKWPVGRPSDGMTTPDPCTELEPLGPRRGERYTSVSEGGTVGTPARVGHRHISSPRRPARASARVHAFEMGPTGPSAPAGWHLCGQLLPRAGIDSRIDTAAVNSRWPTAISADYEVLEWNKIPMVRLLERDKVA